MEKYQDWSINFFADSIPDMEKKSSKLLTEMINLMIESNYTDIQQLFHSVKGAKYSGQGYLEDVDDDNETKTLCRIGYTYALVDVMQLYLDKLVIEKEIQKVQTQYRDRMLRCLEEHGTMLHKDLAAEMGISASGLNAVIRQMNASEVKLIHVREVSKYKIYSLTAAAHRYAVKHNLLKPETQKDTGNRNQQYNRLRIYYLHLCSRREEKMNSVIREYLMETAEMKNDWGQKPLINFSQTLRNQKSKVVTMREYKRQLCRDTYRLLKVNGG